MQTELDIRHWEEIIVRDLPKGATGIIAIHNTNRGPALGGYRFFDYNHHPFRAFMAMEDVLRLSRGMSYKAAAANLKLGGGKSVIMANPANYTPEERRELFVAFGDMVESLGGRYITAEDVGTVLEDIGRRSNPYHSRDWPSSGTWWIGRPKSPNGCGCVGSHQSWPGTST